MKKGLLLAILSALLSSPSESQEIWFFSEGTDQNYYDQGIVNIASLGASIFEHTNPPGYPQYNDKVPCSTTAFRGGTSLKFNYTSSSAGNWKASIFRSGWTTADLSGMDSISFYIFSATEVPSVALPLIGLMAIKKTSSDEVSSLLYRLSDYNVSIPAGEWRRITFPLSIIRDDIGNSDLDFTRVKAVIFSQSETNNTSRTVYIDDITGYKSLTVIPPVINLTGTGYDSHAELAWNTPLADLSYRVYASFNSGTSYELRAETSDSVYLDFVPPAERIRQCSTVWLRLFKTENPSLWKPMPPSGIILTRSLLTWYNVILSGTSGKELTSNQAWLWNGPMGVTTPQLQVPPGWV
ncbi:MAG: hypothetical protein U5L72_13845 [Bacteroidales bacterium]|nr:hypothetical protein [Bacteroidales bacterium]